MSETTYRVIWSRGPTYAVEVTNLDGKRRTVSPFEREADAQAWIAEAKWKDAKGAGKGKPPASKKPGRVPLDLSTSIDGRNLGVAMILLTDDDEFYRGVIRSTLEANAYQVIEAAGGAEGVEMYQTCKPALVITDMRMPGMDGAEVIRAIREIDRRARIVAVTGAETFNKVDYLKLAEEAGADAVLRKLDSTNRVLVEVGRLLEPA